MKLFLLLLLHRVCHILLTRSTPRTVELLKKNKTPKLTPPRSPTMLITAPPLFAPADLWLPPLSSDQSGAEAGPGGPLWLTDPPPLLVAYCTYFRIEL